MISFLSSKKYWGLQSIMKRVKASQIRVPFLIESIALFIVPFEELLTLPFGSVLRIINLVNIAIIVFTEKRVRLDWRKKSPIPYMLFFLFFAILSGIWCFNRGLYLDRLVTYGMYIFLIMLLRPLNPNEDERNWMVTGFFLGGVLATLMLLYNRGATVDIGGRETIAINGKGVNANILAISIEMTFVISFYLLIFKKYSRVKKTALIALLIVLFIGMLNVGSRGAMVSAIVTCGCIVMGVRFDRNAFIKRLALVIIGCTLILFVYFQIILTTQLGARFTLDNLIGVGTLGTANRERIWRIAFQKIFQNPFIGYGAGSSPYVIETEYKFYGTHNSYIMILLEFGIVGFSLVTLWFVNIFRACKASKEKIFLYVFISLLFVIFFVEGFSTKIFWGVMVLVHTCCQTIQDSKEA